MVRNHSGKLDRSLRELNEPNQFVTKPNLLALGFNIISLRSTNSYLDKLQKGCRVEIDNCVLSGTSMVTPICAGVVVLMKQYDSNLQPDGVKPFLSWRNSYIRRFGKGKNLKGGFYGSFRLVKLATRPYSYN